MYDNIDSYSLGEPRRSSLQGFSLTNLVPPCSALFIYYMRYHSMIVILRLGEEEAGMCGWGERERGGRMKKWDEL